MLNAGRASWPAFLIRRLGLKLTPVSLQSLPLVILLSLTATPALAARAPVTPDGWGDVRIGMKERDLVRRYHLRIPRNDGVSSFDCRELGGSSLPFGVMTERGRVTRITILDHIVKTDRGLGVGATQAQVRKAYGAALTTAPSVYEDPPAVYLTYRAKNGHGIRYETDETGRVARIHAGGGSITYVEGCS
jgi:hypothetical protein